MPRLDDVGEISTEGERTIHWVVPGLRKMPTGLNTIVVSPYFDFCGEECGFILYPNGCGFSVGWLGIDCGIPSIPSGSEVHLSVVDRTGREVLQKRADEGSYFYQQFKWIPRAELEAKRREILPEGKLHVVCRIFFPGEKGHTIEEVESEDEDNNSKEEQQ